MVRMFALMLTMFIIPKAHAISDAGLIRLCAPAVPALLKKLATHEHRDFQRRVFKVEEVENHPSNPWKSVSFSSMTTDGVKLIVQTSYGPGQKGCDGNVGPGL